jgi:uncharacterized protein (DUF697 family)
MAAVTPWGFWKTVQTVSPRAIEEEVAASFKLALVGRPEDRAALRTVLLTEAATEIEREDAESYLREFDAPPDPDTAGAFAFTLYTGGPDEPLGVRGSNAVPLVGTLEQIVNGMLDLRPDLTLALARRFRRFRVPACNRLIQATSKVNASVALISALPGVLPITAPFLPASSVADVILLTKNQIVLVMRLAAAHGQKPAYGKQVKELLGTVGSALGWRTAARELVGLVPAGVGAALKAAIAYSGTVAVGKAALWFYQSGGQKPTPEAIREAYAESEAEAKQAVEEISRPGAEPQ